MKNKVMGISKKLKLKQQRLKEDKRKQIEERYNKIQELSKNHNPLPERGRYNNTHTHIGVNQNSNMINVKQGYFNKGKYQHKAVETVPIHYLKWMLETKELNKSEMGLIRKLIKKSEVE